MSRAWVFGAIPLVCLAAVVGCSGGGKSSRPTPLPPNVDPSELFNLRPDSAPLADASPYYRKDDVTIRPAVPSNPLRAAQKLPSEFNIKQYRQAERNQLRQQSEFQTDPERRRQLKEIENRKADADFDDRVDKLGQVVESLAGVVVPPGLLNRLIDADGIKDNTKYNTRLRFKNEEKAANEAARVKADAERRALLSQAPPLAYPGAKYDILILSGGGSRSLFLYGVVCGWADCGTMPDFQVITGVSGGSLAAACLFAGREYLNELRHIFLTAEQKLLHGTFWDRKRFPHPFGLGTESVVDTTKIRKHARTVFNKPGYFETVAAEHAKGRRLYVGTTNLDTQRFVVWDMGAIASEGTAESRKLFEDILLASAAMAPLMPPSRITMTIDGKRYEELHIDGGFSRNLFFYAPADWPGEDEDAKTGYRMLAGARVHVVLGGKVYESPAGTDPKLLPELARGIGTFQTALQRAELARIYSFCQDRDMTMRLAAIPDDYGPLPKPAVFQPGDSTRLFCLGYSGVQAGTVWDESPPERAVSEDRPRRSATLTTTSDGEIGPLLPIRPGQGQSRARGR